MPNSDQAQVITERVGDTLVVTLNNPTRRNAVNPVMAQGLQDAFEEQEKDSSIRAVVLTGAGGHFCSGGDLKGMAAGRGAKRVQFANSRKIATQITGASVPVISAVEGWAVGAGFSLALLADTVVASREAGFMASFPKVGLIPDYGLLETLVQRVGFSKAKQIILYGKTVKAEQGHEIGMIDELVDSGQALEKALEIASDVSLLAPRAVRAIKDYYSGTIVRALDYERIIQPELLMSEDAAEGRAALMEKRKPEFQDK